MAAACGVIYVAVVAMETIKHHVVFVVPKIKMLKNVC